MRAARTFTIPGEPVGKGRPRATTIGGHARMYTPSKTANYERRVAMAYRQAYPGLPSHAAHVPLGLTIVCVWTHPASWSKRRKAETKWQTSAPDLDNIVKAVSDALNGIAWHDDAQVVHIGASKRYGDENAVYVSIWQTAEAVAVMAGNTREACDVAAGDACGG